MSGITQAERDRRALREERARLAEAAELEARADRIWRTAAVTQQEALRLYARAARLREQR